MEKPNLLDILLFPKSYFAKITDKLPTLFLGIIFVGLSNGVFLLLDHIPGLFYNKELTVLIFNSTLALCISILLGLIHIIFFSLPLFDLFKFFRVKERIKNIDGQLIKLMKVYISAHFIIVPVQGFFEAVIRMYKWAGMTSSFALSLALIQFIMIPIWLGAIVARGINTIYDFDDRLKSMIFVLAYGWHLILSYAISYTIGNWIPLLFK